MATGTHHYELPRKVLQLVHPSALRELRDQLKNARGKEMRKGMLFALSGTNVVLARQEALSLVLEEIENRRRTASGTTLQR